jgi:hypothetical protein
MLLLALIATMPIIIVVIIIIIIIPMVTTTSMQIIEPITQQSLQIDFHNRFRYEIIKPTHFRCDLFLICVVRGACYNIRNIRLGYLHLLEEHMQRLDDLIPIHDWHFNVHENDLIFMTFITHFLLALHISIADFLVSLLSIESFVHRCRGK